VQLAQRRRKRELERIEDGRLLVKHLAYREFAFLWNKSLEFGRQRLIGPLQCGNQ
jgi:hypothetical protein